MSSSKSVYRARKPYFFQGPPPNSSGQEGDFAISKDIKGLSLYVKYLKRWQRVAGLENQAQKGQGKYIGIEKKTFKSLETDEVVSKKNIKARNITSSYKHQQTKNDTITGVDVDVTQSNVTASGQTINNVGIDVDVDTSTPTNVGTTNTTGVDVYAKAGTSGTTVSTGINVKSEGADTNLGVYIDTPNLTGKGIKMPSSAAAADYCTINTGANGATTIATVDDDSELAHFTINADGDVYLDAELGGSGDYIGLKNSGTIFGTFQVHHSASWLYLYENGGASTSDHLSFKVEASGVSTIATLDAAASAADLILDIDGDITLDSDTGKFIAKKGGTEFSSTGSAYAGMILGYTHLSPTTSQFVSLTTSLAVVDADAKVTFVAPPSGNVEIGVNYYRDSVSSNKSITAALSDNATFNQATAELGDGSTTWDLGYVYGGDVADETDDRYNTIKFVAGGLTAGSSYTYWLALATSATTTRIRYGGRQDTDPDRFYPPIIMKATALPASIHTDT